MIDSKRALIRIDATGKNRPLSVSVFRKTRSEIRIERQDARERRVGNKFFGGQRNVVRFRKRILLNIYQPK